MTTIAPAIEYSISTPFGTVWLTPIGINTVRFDANTDGRKITVNNGEVTASGFFNREGDEWFVGGYTSVQKVWSSRNGYQPASPKQREKLLTTLGPIIKAWADENQGLLDLGEQRNLLLRRSSLEHMLTGAKRQVQTYLAEVAEVDAALARLS